MIEHIAATRVVATPAAIDAAVLVSQAIVMRVAPDELLILDAAPVPVNLPDEHAIIVADAGWSGTWLDATTAERFLIHACEWELPTQRPAFAQGMVAQLAVKLWLEPQRTLILVPTPLAAELADRLERFL